MSNISFAESAWEEYLLWQSNDKKTVKKINTLLRDIMRQPFEGLGKPEPLKGYDGCWSRRINEKDRLVYLVTNDEIFILQCRGHYDSH